MTEKQRKIGVSIECVEMTTIDATGNQIQERNRIMIVPTLAIPKPAAVRVIIRVEHYSELTFMAKPGTEKQMAEAATKQSGFWQAALSAEEAGIVIPPLEKAAMAAAYYGLRIREDQAKRGRKPS